MRLLTTVLFACALAAPAAAGERYQFDPDHSQIRFTYNHLGFSNILGLIAGVEGELMYDPDHPENSRVEASIPLAGMTTGVARMDTHLKNPDFFEIERFPTARFVSTRVTSTGEGRLQVAGELTLRDQTREVVLEVTLNGRGEHPMRKRPAIGFDAQVRLQRSAFGLDKYPSAVADEVDVAITVEANAATD